MADTGTTTPFGSLERSLSWRYLRAQRAHGGASLVAVISFVGIMLATFALIVIMSVMGGFRATLIDALLGGQPHISVMTGDRPSEDADISALKIRALPGVTSVEPALEAPVMVVSEGVGSQPGFVRGIKTAQLKEFEFLSDGGEAAIAAGFGQGRNGGNVILLGRNLANSLGAYEGATVKIITASMNSTVIGGTPRNKDYIVGGTFATGSVELDKALIFMPMEQAQIFFQKKGQYDYLDVRLDDPETSKAMMDIIAEATGNSYYIDDWQTRMGGYLNALNIERSMMRIVMLVLISVTSLLIIMGVVMLVKNKKRDIAILRTIGLSQGAVMRVFIMIGGVLGLVGSLIGLFLGVLVVLNIGIVEGALNVLMGGPVFDPDTYGLNGLPAKLDWSEVAFAIGWAFIMSTLVTIIPAWWAARQDPVAALRYE